jgi:hypothetical protein
MAARRLLIVMLILLGLSTLAAALVPQHALRGGATSGTTTTQPTQSTTTASPPIGRSLSAKIVVGGKQVPVVAGPVCKKPKPSCEPIHVGDQLSLSVLSRGQAELEIPEFGLVGVASKNTPAFFQLLLDQPENVGVLFTSPHGVAARIEVLSAKAAAEALRPSSSKAKRPARGGSGPA